MKAKNKYQKYKYYLIKRKEVFVHSLRKSQLLGRKVGPKVVLNSLPKSGTHLLETLFFNLPLMRHSGKKTLRIQTQNPIDPKLKFISSLKKGQFLLAHMQYHKSIIHTANDNDAKIIHLIRDPRDVMLSHLNYVEKMDTTQKSHAFITKYDNRLDRLKAMIEGKENVLEPFPVVLDKFAPWLNHNNVLILKFEDLIGEKGGGSKEAQINAVIKTCEFISIDIEESEIEKISNSIYSPKSSTFNKGKIGNWNKVLNEDEKKWLNNIISKQIKSYDYE